VESDAAVLITYHYHHSVA